MRTSPTPTRRGFRAVTDRAGAPIVFRWLCQLRVAPYSYDALDNLGRRSPRQLTPGLERLAVGQRFMTIFRLAEFDPGRELTLVLDSGSGALFGSLAVTYRVIPQGDARSRLVVKLTIRYPRAPHGWLMRRILPLGDLVMMRRQLHTLRSLSERDAAMGTPPQGI